MKNALFLLSVSLFVAGCSDSGNWAVLQGQTMGTYYNVTYHDIENQVNSDDLDSQIEKLLLDINQSMSTYIDDSELSRLNSDKSTGPVVLSSELFNVINTAQVISELTDGAFDITVGPLVNLWGFGPYPNQSVPADDMIESTLRLVGYDNLILNEGNNSITRTRELIYIDLSAIAKGYAVDRIAGLLDLLDIQDYLVDIGGELRANGTNKQQQPWLIGIEKPDPVARSAQSIVQLTNMAMATSGDYRNYFERDEERFTHTIDPATGRPVTHSTASVTVIHKDCMYADALATAMLVMGKDDSMALANQLDIPIYIINRTESGFEAIHNKSFDKYLVEP